jgi:acyl-CoA synthetase (AMP-forming)/AMP-acid ligase II
MQVAGVSVHAWYTSRLVSRSMQLKAAAWPRAGWPGSTARAIYRAVSAALGGPASALLPDCSIAHICTFVVLGCFIVGAIMPLTFTYLNERRSKRVLLAAAEAANTAGSLNGGDSSPLRTWWAPLAAWVLLALLWRVAGLFTLAQGDDVACPPGFY